MIRGQLKSTETLQPKSIMTDGDAAIHAAIKLVWPLTNHLLCIWHIIHKNAPDNLKKIMAIENSKKFLHALFIYYLF